MPQLIVHGCEMSLWVKLPAAVESSDGTVWKELELPGVRIVVFPEKHHDD